LSFVFIALVAALMVTMECGIAPRATASARYYQDQKGRLPQGGGMPDNTAYFRRMLNSIENHIDAVRKAHVENTRRRDLFEMAKTDKDLAQRLDALRGRGVRFLI
jgi:hypothetical protein